MRPGPTCCTSWFKKLFALQQRGFPPKGSLLHCCEGLVYRQSSAMRRAAVCKCAGMRVCICVCVRDMRVCVCDVCEICVCAHELGGLSGTSTDIFRSLGAQVYDYGRCCLSRPLGLWVFLQQFEHHACCASGVLQLDLLSCQQFERSLSGLDVGIPQVLPSPQAAKAPTTGLLHADSASASDMHVGDPLACQAILSAGRFPFCWDIVEAVQRCLLQRDLVLLAEEKSDAAFVQSWGLGAAGAGGTEDPIYLCKMSPGYCLQGSRTQAAWLPGQPPRQTPATCVFKRSSLVADTRSQIY